MLERQYYEKYWELLRDIAKFCIHPESLVSTYVN